MSTASKESPLKGGNPVMVLAHNEAAHIVRCLDSIQAADPDMAFRIFVMANGCTDCTEDIVREYARSHPEVTLVSITRADKCNAWNVFINETVAEYRLIDDVVYFMDGDARACPGSFSALARCLQEHPGAHAAAALPASGRNMTASRKTMMKDHNLVANLYALTGQFVARCRDLGVRIPLGLEGDDGLLGALVKWDLDPTGGWDNSLLIPCPDAGFVFDSLSWRRPRDWRGYWRRRVRYARSRYEFQLLGRRLKKDGIRGLPEHISELYRDAGECRLRWEGIQTLFNWIALRQLRKYASV